MEETERKQVEENQCEEKDSSGENAVPENPDSPSLQSNVEEITVSTSDVDSGLVLLNMPAVNSESKTVSISTTSQGTPVLVLTNNAQKGTVEANVLIEEQQGIARWMRLAASEQSSLHALAQANLVVQTQERIAKEYGILTGNIQTTPAEPENKKAEEKYYICNVEGCGRTFTTHGYFRYHQSVHSGQRALKCTYEGCNRKFSWPAHLKYHLLTHTGTRLYQCEHEGCGKSFYTAQRLTVHMRVHSGDRPFTCPEPDCLKSFTTAGNLKNHMRVHTGERPYVCGIEHCGRRFAEYSSLRKHKLVHSGDKPFVCNICGKGFSQSGSRNVHIKRHQTSDKWKTSDRGASMEQSSENQAVSGLEADVFVLRQADDLLQYQDHVVTVTTQSDSDTGLGREMLGSEEILGHAEVISESGEPSIPTHNPTGANVVVLSQPQEIVTMSTNFHGSEQNTREEIVYDSDLLHAELDHEEIAGHELIVETLPQTHNPDESHLVAGSDLQNRTAMDIMIESDEFECGDL